eukprot:13251664-Alexandrium_andersonii.AAC.1
MPAWRVLTKGPPSVWLGRCRARLGRQQLSHRAQRLLRPLAAGRRRSGQHQPRGGRGSLSLIHI